MASLKLSDTILLGCLLPSSFLYKNIYMYTYNFFFSLTPKHSRILYSFYFSLCSALLLQSTLFYFIFFLFFIPHVPTTVCEQKAKFCDDFCQSHTSLLAFFFFFFTFFFYTFSPFQLTHARTRQSFGL